MSFADHTLDQLRAQFGSRLPVVRIDDEPVFANRGLMLDVSRCRVPTMDEFARILPQLASLKFNHLQLYLEHAFAYEDAESIWGGCSPLTGEEVRHLSASADRLGIELAANQNCFGHLTRWLEDPVFSHLAETHGEWDFAGMPRSGPFSLCPTDERSLEFAGRLLDELLPHFTGSALVNLGCDETHDVGQGRSRAAVAARGKGAVWARFVGTLCRRVIEGGHFPMVWGDIAAEHPGAIASLPPDVIGLVWGYEPGTDFRRMGHAWRSRGHPWWVCPGLSDWRSFTGRASERRANIRGGASQGLDGGAAGFLATSWGDLGHRQSWPVTLMGIAEAADAAWSGGDRDASFLDAVSLQVFGDRRLEIAPWLESLGDVDSALRASSGPRDASGSPTALPNASALFTELHPPPLDLGLPKRVGPWAEVHERLVELRETVPTGAGPLIERECRHAVDQAIFASRIAIARRTGNRDGLDVAAEVRTLKVEHAALWTERSRPGGLDESLSFWDTIGLAEGVR